MWNSATAFATMPSQVRKHFDRDRLLDVINQYICDQCIPDLSYIRCTMQCNTN